MYAVIRVVLLPLFIDDGQVDGKSQYAEFEHGNRPNAKRLFHLS
jgi:hypothetical protein